MEIYGINFLTLPFLICISKHHHHHIDQPHEEKVESVLKSEVVETNINNPILSTVHNREPFYRCDDCDKDFEDFEMFIYHVKDSSYRLNKPGTIHL
jgi:hypothetical protein